jgi:hypothetical protein
MLQSWNKDGKQGTITYPKGEVVYQTKGVVIEPLYQSNDNKWYIEDNGKLQEVMYNGFNGYCYRQDGL